MLASRVRMGGYKRDNFIDKTDFYIMGRNPYLEKLYRTSDFNEYERIGNFPASATTLNDIQYFPTKNIWLIASNNRIMSSTDMRHWTERGMLFNDVSSNIIFTGTVFVVGGGYKQYVQTSTNGTSWSSILLPDFEGQYSSISSIAYGNGYLIAVGSAGQSFRSADGETWTKLDTTPTRMNLNSIEFHNNRWCMGGYAGEMYYSNNNGGSWTQANSVSGSSGGVYSIKYANGIWVATGGASAIATSIDGITWTRRVSSIPSSTLRNLYYYNDIWYACSSNGDMYKSTSVTTNNSWTKVSNVSGNARAMYHYKKE